MNHHLWSLIEATWRWNKGISQGYFQDTLIYLYLIAINSVRLKIRGLIIKYEAEMTCFKLGFDLTYDLDVKGLLFQTGLYGNRCGYWIAYLIVWKRECILCVMGFWPCTDLCHHFTVSLQYKDLKCLNISGSHNMK